MIPVLSLLMACAGSGSQGKDNSDLDGDGFSVAEDCDDNDKNIFPGAGDTVGDGVDNNCDSVDGVDSDGDGAASEASGGDDCDDGDGARFPGAEDSVGDGVDQNCDGLDGVDADGDGAASTGSGGQDCDDGDAMFHPLAEDTVGDGIDQNCDGLDGVDADADGHASRSSGGEDCDDASASIYPGAEEIWYDDIDQDCARDCDWDQDLDGYFEPGVPSVDNGPCDLDPTNGVVDLPEDCDDLDPAATDNVLIEVFPQDGTADAYYRTTVEAMMSEAEPGATLELLDALGAPLSGVTTEVESTLVFTPDVPLDALTSYTASLTWSCGVHQWTFTTGELGAPTFPDLIFGRTYAVDLGSGRWIEPPGVGALIAGVIDFNLLLGVESSDPDLGFLFGFEDSIAPGAQDMCVETTRSALTPFVDNPYFSMSVPSLNLDLGVEVPLSGGALTGSFAADASYIGGMTLEGLIDTRPLAPLVGGLGPYDVCALLLAFGVSCEVCPSDGAVACVDVMVDSLIANEVSGLWLVPRTAADITADPSCP